MSANQRVAGLRTVAARVRAARIDLRLLAELEPSLAQFATALEALAQALDDSMQA